MHGNMGSQKPFCNRPARRFSSIRSRRRRCPSPAAPQSESHRAAWVAGPRSYRCLCRWCSAILRSADSSLACSIKHVLSRLKKALPSSRSIPGRHTPKCQNSYPDVTRSNCVYFKLLPGPIVDTPHLLLLVSPAAVLWLPIGARTLCRSRRGKLTQPVFWHPPHRNRRFSLNTTGRYRGPCRVF